MSNANRIPSTVRALLEELQCDTTQERAERIGNMLAQYPEPQPAPIITAETPADYGNDVIREYARELVEREVFYCVSSLVSDIAKSTAASHALDVEDEVIALCCRDDWETPGREYLEGLDAEELREIGQYLDVDGADAWDDDADDTESMTRAIVTHCEAATEQWCELCDYCRIDPDTVEAYEHWIVSDWLVSKLKEKGEIVDRDFLGLTIWGRCTTGQSISMDHVMLSIARDCLAGV